MNTLLIQEYYYVPTNDFQLNYHSKNHVFSYEKDPGIIDEFSLVSNELSPVVDGSSSEGEISKEGDSCVVRRESDESDEEVEEIFKQQGGDHSNAMITFISQMLMEEEDLKTKPCMLHDSLALQATQKSYYDLLTNNNNNNNNNDDDDDDDAAAADSSNSQNNNSSGSCSSSDVASFVESNWTQQEVDFVESLLMIPSFKDDQYLQSFGSIPFSSSSAKKNRRRQRGEENDFIQDGRSSKQFVNDIRESESLELLDQVLLCSETDRGNLPCGGGIDEVEAKKQMHEKDQSRRSNRGGRPKGGKKHGIVKEVVDLRSLLMQCAQAYDSRTVNNLLAQIRQHSSPHGDGTERLAHYFANALDARLAGTGSMSYAGFLSKRISAAEILKAYQAYIIACPFRKMSNVIANKTIKKLANGAKTLHIIDFGILYGYQWPCLIQALSERPGGAPKLRITGIDFPQPGFRPAERVEESGFRLKKYCERFGVPFEYNAIAQKWETIKVEDLKIERDDLLIVNSLYRLDNVPDETVVVNSPRDAVLNLVRKINPHMFIHGLMNGTYNTPFFVTRFRESLFHFSALFDMFEATLPRDDEHRKLYEQEIFGKDVMNIIACEGTERVNRPETYKQWQVRNKRAGFRQVPIDQQLVKYVRYRVKMDYDKDFSVDEDGKWILQGWKGRVIHALSFWQPKNRSSK